MKYRILQTICLLAISATAFAQVPAPKEKMTREEKDEKNAAREARINAKNEYIIFRRQINALPEFAEEKRKAAKLASDTKQPIKVVVAIDSLDEGDTTTKALTGYIVQNNGDNATLLYDLSFDRKERKIISVKRNVEAIEAEKAAKEEKEERDAEKAEKKAEAKEAKPGAPKKKKSEDDDDDEGDD